MLGIMLLAGCGASSGTAATSAAAAAAASAAADSAAAATTAAPAASTSAAAEAATSAAPSPKVTTSQTAPVTLSADGVIDDSAMSTIQMKMNGAIQDFLKADDIRIDGEMQRGMQATISYTLDKEGDYVATHVVVNNAPHSVTGTIYDEAMNTLILTVTDGSFNGNVTFSKDENYVRDEDLLVNSKVEVYYEGELDGDMPIVYAMLDPQQ